MKGAILTFNFNNFGTILQAYALQFSLSKLGYEVEIINYTGDWITDKKGLLRILYRDLKYNTLSVGIRLLIDRIKFFQEKRKFIYTKELHYSRANKYIDFKSRYMTYSRACKTVSETMSLLNEYDFIIVGSDQIWNYERNPNYEVFLLNGYNGKKISYAASFGVVELENPYKFVFQNSLKHFDSISIREDEGIKILNDIGIQNINLVLDPTLLINGNTWLELLNIDNKIIDEDYMLVYSLNQSYEIYEEARKYCKENNLKLVCVKRSNCPPYIMEDEYDLFDIGPKEFVSLVKYAKCVITNSYHAVLFSINLQTDFFAFLNKSENVNSRILSILDMLDMSSNVVWEGYEHICEKCSLAKRNESKFNEWINKSFDYLNLSLQDIYV